MLELRTLGGLHVRDSQGHELRAMLAAPKQAALLTYLSIATPRGFHRRDTLLALLWPELDQEHARGALRQALHASRRSVADGMLLGAGDEEIGLDWDGVWCDAVAFEAMLDEGRVQEALEIYRGDLLEGFHLSGCPEFERWLDSERRRLRERAAEATWSLAEGAEAVGQVAKAAHWGRRAAALSPDDEGVVRRLIALLDRAGDRAGAIQEYEAFAKRLREDYEAEPAPETTALIESVRARKQANGAVLPSAPVTKQPDDAGAASLTTQPRPFWRTKRLVAAALVVLGAVTVAGTTTLRNSRANTPLLDSRRVLVAPFENETGDATLDPLGRIVTDWITQGLARTGLVQVVPAVTFIRGSRSANAGSAEPDDDGAVVRLAQRLGVRVVVSGAYYRRGDELLFQARLTDGRTGAILLPLEAVVAPAGAPLGGAEVLRQRTTAAVATVLDERLASWAAPASQPPSYEAYTLYTEGLELLTRAQTEHLDMRPEWRKTTFQAVQRFLLAARMDSSFTAPLLWAVEARPRRKMRDSLLGILELRRTALAPWDLAMLDYLQARWRADPTGEYVALRRMNTFVVSAEWRFRLAVAALEAKRPRETLALLLDVEPGSAWIQPPHLHRAYLLAARHMLGQHERLLEDFARFRDELGDFSWGLNAGVMAVGALAELGRADEAVHLAEEILSHTRWSYSRSVLPSALRAHGQPEAARRVAERALQKFQEPLPPEVPQVDPDANYAGVLRLSGRLDQARAFLEERVVPTPEASGGAGSPPHGEWHGYMHMLGVVAAEQGDRERAREMVAQIARLKKNPGSEFGRYGGTNVWLADIAAALGDRKEAVARLRAAFDDGMIYGSYLHDKLLAWAELRGDPAFEALMRPK